MTKLFECCSTVSLMESIMNLFESKPPTNSVLSSQWHWLCHVLSLLPLNYPCFLPQIRLLVMEDISLTSWNIRNPTKNRGEDGPFINLCPSTWSKWKLYIFHWPKHITCRLYQNRESYPPDLQRCVEILYPRSSSTTSGTGLVTLQAGFTVPKGASVRSSCPLLKHQKKRCFTPIRPTQTPIRKSPIFLGGFHTSELRGCFVVTW